MASDQFEEKAWEEQQGVDGSMQEQTLKYGISDSKKSIWEGVVVIWSTYFWQVQEDKGK